MCFEQREDAERVMAVLGKLMAACATCNCKSPMAWPRPIAQALRAFLDFSTIKLSFGALRS